MAIKYKIDVLEALKERGITTYSLRKAENPNDRISESSLTKIRSGVMVDINVLDRLCRLLNLPIADIILYVPDEQIKEI